MEQSTGKKPIFTSKKPKSIGERLHWDNFIKPWLVRLIFVGIGLLIGLYIVAPGQVRASDNYLPSSFTDISTGIVQHTNAEGVNTYLPIRLADNSTARRSGFNDVGVLALDNTFLLYAQSRETTRSTGYDLTNVRAQLQLAVISGEGAVVAIQDGPVGTERLSVDDNHRWVLAAKAGTFELYGITVGSVLDPESIQKINFQR
jgi:uncharacterized membrane protein (UPF0127 family)